MPWACSHTREPQLWAVGASRNRYGCSKAGTTKTHLLYPLTQLPMKRIPHGPLQSTKHARKLCRTAAPLRSGGLQTGQDGSGSSSAPNCHPLYLDLYLRVWSGKCAIPSRELSKVKASFINSLRTGEAPPTSHMNTGFQKHIYSKCTGILNYQLQSLSTINNYTKRDDASKTT